MLYAGTSIVDISPCKGVQLAGYPHCPRPNTGVHDPLYAACLYLSDGNSDIALVTLDLLYLGKQHVKKIREKTGKTVMFAASHTHSGPWASEALASEHAEGICANGEYIEALADKLCRLIDKAASETFEAQIGAAAGSCGAAQGVGGNRREKGGICDPSVNVLAVRDLSGAVRACLVNYALHPTFLHAENTLVTADYPGYIRRYFSFAYPGAVALFAQGASGDQSSRYHRVAQDFEEAARVGTTIAAEAARCVDNMAFCDAAPIKVKSEEIDLPLRRFLPLAEAKENLERAQTEFAAARNADYITMRNAELALFGAENALTFAKMQKEGFVSGELPCEIQTVSIGDTLIVGIQGELFVSYAIDIKAASSAAKTFVFEVTNGALPGYVYTKEAEKEGGYEVGTSMLSPLSGEKIVDRVKKMM
ncbi:MAG: neutral/alkaline non-lysosomal ceramidase N-terminal domain-containing protein [Oscillospiraceae bacterium]|nr:neutral/alkaline non-lysosomal ceramidase N-terminal domain-containing protein [Oscillospiraceae bacterium]